MSTTSEVAARLEVGLRLAITQDDIDCAIERNQFNCAIVRSIQRQFPEAIRVRVNTETIAFTLEDEDVRFTFPTPEVAIERVIKPLDTGHMPKPTAITIKGGRMRAVEHENRRRAAREHERTIPAAQKAARPSVQINKGVNTKADYRRFAPDE